MNKDWYISNGYAVGLNVSQGIIDRAEKDVFHAYVKPILPAAVFPFEDDELMHVVADIVFLLVLQRNLRVTRSGAKEKSNANSQNASEWAALSEQASTAALAVDRLKVMPGAAEKPEVKDIAKIYFKTNFFYQ